MFRDNCRRGLKPESLLGRYSRRRASRGRVHSQTFVLEQLEDRTLLSISGSGLRGMADFSSLTVDPMTFEPSSILVRFRSETMSRSGTGFLTGTEIEPEIPLVPGLHRVDLAPSVTVQTALAAYRASPVVMYAEPDYRVSVATVPNDPQFNLLWGLQNTGQTGGTPGADIHAPAAWDVTTGSTHTTVAVIDTGMDYNHPDLYENVWINQAEIPASRRANLVDVDGDGLITFYDLNDPINQGPGKITDINGDGRIDAADILAPMQLDSNGNDTGLGGWASGSTQDGDTQHPDDLIGWNFVSNTKDPFDDNSHGTHVSGTIGAMGNNGLGVVGVNWRTQIMAAKFLDASGHGSTSDAIAALNFVVAHGATVSNNSWGSPPGYGYSQGLLYAIRRAGQDGHIFVAAAGNNYGNNNDVTPTYPATYNSNNIIPVAATTDTDTLADFSNIGPITVHLGAPGKNVYSTVPGGGYGYKSGTSMATPHVTGVVALVRSLHPDWPYSEVIAQTIFTVDRLSTLQGKVKTGGRLNAVRAVGSEDWHSSSSRGAVNYWYRKFMVENLFFVENFFFRGNDGNLYIHSYDHAVGRWDNHNNPGVPLASNPAVTNYTGGDGFVYENVFANGNDGNLYYQHYDGGWHWVNLDNPGVPLVGDPSVTNYGGGNGFLYENVFARGGNGNLYYKYYDGDWHWANLGNPGVPLSGSPSVINYRNGNGFLYENVFARASDGNLYYKYYDGDWHWANLGNPGVPLASNPAVTNYLGVNGFLYENVFARGGDGNLYCKAYDGGWHWVNLGNPGVPLSGDPVVINYPSGNGFLYENAFARGSDGKLYCAVFDGGWHWANLGNPGVPLSGDPMVLNYPWNGFLNEDAFGWGSDGNLYQDLYDGGWNWQYHGSPGSWFIPGSSASSQTPVDGTELPRPVQESPVLVPVLTGTAEARLGAQAVAPERYVTALLFATRGRTNRLLEPLAWLSLAEMDLLSLNLLGGP